MRPLFPLPPLERGQWDTNSTHGLGSLCHSAILEKAVFTIYIDPSNENVHVTLLILGYYFLQQRET